MTTTATTATATATANTANNANTQPPLTDRQVLQLRAFADYVGDRRVSKTCADAIACMCSAEERANLSGKFHDFASDIAAFVFDLVDKLRLDAQRLRDQADEVDRRADLLSADA